MQVRREIISAMDIKTDIDHQGKVRVLEARGRFAGRGCTVKGAMLIPLVLIAAMLLGTLCPAGAAESAPPPPPKGFSYDFGLDMGITSVDITNAHFGLGVGGLESMDPNADFVYLKDLTRVEAYVAPRAGAKWVYDNGSTLRGELRVVAAATRGDGDPWYLTYDNPSNIDVDNLYLAWTSGDAIPALGKDGLEVSVGRQNFQLGDGMVLVDGNYEANREGAVYWLDPQKGWENAGIVRLKFAPVKLELFGLSTNDVSDNDTILGGNLELVSEKLGRVGVSHFQVLESDAIGREGLTVTAVHGRGKPIPSFPLLEVAAEYDWQQNDDPKKEATAWFAEANLSLYMLPWYPTIGYRYASFSGDDASTGKDEGWDWLHNGYADRGFGYWYQGIVVGTYETRLTNLDTHFVHLTVAPPIRGTWFKALYYDHRFNDASTARLDGEAVSSDKFATEWDLIFGFSPTKKYDLMAIYGNATPGQGGKDRTYGADENERLIQFVVLVHF
jgi:hypothetical protein